MVHDDDTFVDVCHPGKFNIDEESGTVTALVSLDRERDGDFLQFHVLANVLGHDTASHALILFTLVDVDDERPRFVSPRYSFSLPENVAVGSFTGVVVAVDRDSSRYADFRYELNSSMFAIDMRSGIIVTRAPLDRETAATHRFTVSVYSATGSRSGGHVDRTDEAIVVVKVDDVNDNSPFFRFPLPTNHTLRVPSTSAIGSTVGRVVAVDADAGDNARLTYYVVTSERHNVFRLMADSGEMTVVGNLSALVATSSPRHLRFVVGVRDGGRPSRSATGVLTVVVSSVPASGTGNASSISLSASHASSVVMVDSSIMAAIAAIAGCFVVTIVFSLLAVAVHRRTAGSALGTRGGACGSASSRAAWSKVATTDLSGIDSPLYTAVVNSATTTSLTGNGKVPELCCDGPDIILTLESEPVNYAVSILYQITVY